MQRLGAMLRALMPLSALAHAVQLLFAIGDCSSKIGQGHMQTALLDVQIIMMLYATAP